MLMRTSVCVLRDVSKYCSEILACTMHRSLGRCEPTNAHLDYVPIIIHSYNLSLYVTLSV